MYIWYAVAHFKTCPNMKIQLWSNQESYSETVVFPVMPLFRAVISGNTKDAKNKTGENASKIKSGICTERFLLGVRYYFKGVINRLFSWTLWWKHTIWNFLFLCEFLVWIFDRCAFSLMETQFLTQNVTQCTFKTMKLQIDLWADRVHQRNFF